MDKTFNRNVHHNVVPKDQEFWCNDQMLQLVRVKKFLRWNGNSKNNVLFCSSDQNDRKSCAIYQTTPTDPIALYCGAHF